MKLGEFDSEPRKCENSVETKMVEGGRGGLKKQLNVFCLGLKKRLNEWRWTK
uniref:Uncharacterized protein n=1 Tax=Oryza brachyantha TaxID=4533 RepID=J3LAK8_ORYBR